MAERPQIIAELDAADAAAKGGSMSDKWKPVVGGRAILPDGRQCFVDSFPPHPLSTTIYATVDLSGQQSVQVHRLTEHPADRRHRLLLEAAREVAKWRDALDYSEPGSDARNKAEAQLNYAIDALEVALEEYDA